MRLQLANGEPDGDRVIATNPLERIHLPRTACRPPPAPASTASAGTSPDDDLGRLRLGHTGAFTLGAHTDVTMLPGEQLCIVVLTNGSPVGLADAVALKTAGTTSVAIEAFDAKGLRTFQTSVSRSGRRPGRRSTSRASASASVTTPGPGAPPGSAM